MNIPMDKLSSRLASLAIGGQIITHCPAGPRAEMAYATMRNAGVNASVLNDQVDIPESKIFGCLK